MTEKDATLNESMISLPTLYSSYFSNPMNQTDDWDGIHFGSVIFWKNKELNGRVIDSRNNPFSANKLWIHTGFYSETPMQPT